MTALTRSESKRLAELEQIVHDGKKTFIEVGEALWTIRNEKLHREKEGSFYTYIEHEFGIGKSQAYRLMDAAEVAKEVSVISPIGDISESQLRELKMVEPERRAEVLQKAQESAPVGRDGKPKVTAAAIREAAQELDDAEPEADERDTRLDRAREAMQRFDEIRRLARCLKNEAKCLRSENQIPHLTNGFELQIDSIVDVLKEAQPHASCPFCDGKGCDRCKGRGWIVKVEFGQLSRRDAAKAVEL